MNIFNSSRSRGTTTVNGRTYPAGSSVQISGDGRVTVNGVAQDGEALAGPVSVVIEGGADHVETTSGNVTVKGGCTMVTTMSGNVNCADAGSVKTMSGDVTARDIAGSVSTMSGDVRGAR